ncbi:MAG: FAD-dependent oxidoreductase [Bacteroidia bacterium]
MPAKGAEIGVVGAGAAGLGIAWKLAERGYTVLLLEAREPGSGAMTASGGMLSPAYEAEYEEIPLLQAFLHSRRLYPAWAEALGDIGYTACGTYELALTPEDVPYVRRRWEFERAQGIEVEWLEGAALRRHLPSISPRIPAGTYAPDEGQVLPERLRDRLVEAIQRHRGTILSHTPVQRISYAAQAFHLHTYHQTYTVETLIVCTGVPLEGLSLPFKVYPIRGQMIAVESPHPNWLSAPVRYFNKMTGYGYTIPKGSYLILGGTAEEKGYDTSLTVGGVLDILRRAYYVFPDLYEQRILRFWAGLRPATAERRPVFWKVRGLPLYYVNGLYRNGILLLPLVAEGVAAWVAEGTVHPLLAPFTREVEEGSLALSSAPPAP